MKKSTQVGSVGVAMLAAIGAVSITSQEALATYHTPWSRTDAYNVATTGIDEAYEYGHSKWNDNNVQEAWPTEGADCSGYAGKVWAAPAYTALGTDYSYPYTGAWYGETVDGSVKLAISDSRTRQMDTWVYRVSAGGSSDHMGLFEGSYDSGSGWKIWHAASESTGIVSGHKTDAWLAGNNAKRFKRVNW